MTDKNETEAIDAATSDFVEFCRSAKREVITLSPETFEAFVKLLEEPAKADPHLRALMNRKMTGVKEM
jgi:uncharacterized protein (DUF1778 family)